MEYRQLEYFLKICETGSISRAAAKLYISQQALSKNIENLENSLGLPLFYRSPRGLTLTRYGEVLRGEGEHLLRRHDEILTHLKSLQDEYMQTVSVAFYSGMLTQFPPDFLENFLERHRDTRFHFYSYYDNEHNRRHMNTDVDLFFSSNTISRPDMALLYECHRPMYLLMGQNHPLARQEEIRLSDLQGEYMLGINADYDSQDKLNQALSQNGVVFQTLLSDAEQSFSYSLIRDFHAIACFAGPGFLVPKGTVRRPILDGEFTWNFYIYGRTTGRRPHGASDLVEEIIRFREMD